MSVGRNLLVKLCVAMGVVALPLLLVILGFVLPELREQLREDRILGLKQAVETAYGVLEVYEARERDGTLTRQEAQAQAAEMLARLRYSGVEYFWVNDLDTRLVMHPHLPDMLGKDLKGYRDVRGKPVFVDIVRLAREHGAGAVSYEATRPGSPEAIPKESYVKLFSPWGWVLGTGVYVEDVEREVAAVRQRILVAVGGALLLALLAGVYLSRRVVRPVQELAQAARRVARGDLDARVAVRSADEVGQLSAAFNTMVGGLHEVVRALVEAAGATALDAERIRTSADALSVATREQSDSLQRAAETVQGMSARVSQGAETARTAAKTAVATGAVAREGGEAVGQALRKMEEMAGVVERSATTVERLQASGRVTAEMLRLIQQVAEETQLLAVNTAIEAARAGQHGKGFSVVAGEVRKLANRTRDAAAQVQTMLGRSEADMRAAAELMRQGTTMVHEGLGMSSTAGDALSRLLASVNEIGGKVERMADENTRQSESGEHIARRIHALSVRSTESVAGVQQIARAVEDLHARASKLKELAARFTARA
ncbi:methyl-accepting chemotaxis protein [Comamonas sp. JC664]|uniref:methyl-accepting chemotaxis protein n=1 Tax=Comamonas sp. JC664 TaxID=2801917 RepID=UPI00174D194B|nr:methyl-accepting chemotaxis protein [Comamonas sp. JC664]MBL0698364.1 methyl-accepting chemotaxis protein [Comamonas sp. JC664]GHG89839.1 chemotaxis protein [Comamonas sp. KCTC 72670]